MRRITKHSDLSDLEWVPVKKKPIEVSAARLTETTEIETAKGTLVGHPGDVLVKGIKDEVYAIKREIFEKMYEIIGGGASEQE